VSELKELLFSVNYSVNESDPNICNSLFGLMNNRSLKVRNLGPVKWL
jgi:hypothetical protein